MTEGKVATPTGGPFPAHTVETFLKYSVHELLIKRAFVQNLIIRPLQHDPEMSGDPRAPRALEYYRGERELINEALKRKRYGDAGPPAQVVRLEPLTVTGRAPDPGR